MTMGECVILGSGAFPPPLSFWGAVLSRPLSFWGAAPSRPPVILRSEGDEESLGRALGREGRFFAALRMTMGECAQNDNGGVCSE